MEIKFDDNYEMTISIEQQPNEVFLILSDDLEAIDEELLPLYKQKILAFIENSNNWYSSFKDHILEWGRNQYKVEGDEQGFTLINIFVLFEQEENEVFGLEYGVHFDVEHNCGIKVKMTNGKLELFEIGTGDIAFC